MVQTDDIIKAKISELEDALAEFKQKNATIRKKCQDIIKKAYIEIDKQKKEDLAKKIKNL